jgi:hypothetical protein
MRREKMLLYHGTTSAALESILKDGIKPRGKKDGNWAGTVKSNSKAVYLTNAYPLHFAENSTKKGDKLLVLEIETKGLDPFLFAPDEDLLEQGTRKDPAFADVPGTNPFNMKVRTQWFRNRALKQFGHAWPLSLEKMGTMTYYGDIPASHVTRYALIPHTVEVMMASDPVICPMNYKIMGPYYRQLTKMLFGDKPDPKDFGGPEDWDLQKLNRIYEHPEETLLKGIEVVDLKKRKAA